MRSKARKYFEPLLNRHDILGSVPLGLRLDVWWRIALQRRHRFVYFRIPKAANSTVSKTLAIHAWPERAALNHRLDAIWAKRQFSRMGPFQTAEDLLENWFCFSFFRNPYSRTLSAFMQKLPKRKYRRAARGAGVKAIDRKNFERFVGWLEQGNLHADIHWAPQTLICPVPIERLHFAGRVETLDQDLALLMNRLFPDAGYRQPETRTRDRQHAVEKLQAFYDEPLRKRVEVLFAEDFEQLGYSTALDAAANGPG